MSKGKPKEREGCSQTPMQWELRHTDAAEDTEAIRGRRHGLQAPASTGTRGPSPQAPLV